MKNSFLTAFLLLATLSIPSFASASLTSTADPDLKVLKLSDLRSAYLIRAGVVRYDANSNSPDKLRAQLQRHFDVVLALLQIATPQSIETGLARLEATDDHTWIAAEREAWRQKLLAKRSVQLGRLAAYRDRGLFPLNEGQSRQPVPIFIDKHDTACAVGHLMRLSGWKGAVAEIQKINNLVYVPDSLRSAVFLWVLTSGLTLEEAALIQPSYGGFYTPYLTSNYEPGELSLIKNGLKYENFHIDTVAFNGSWISSNDFIGSFQFHGISKNDCGSEDFEQCSVTGSGSTNPNNVGFNAGEGMIQGYFIDHFDPIGTHWITIGGYESGVETGNPLINGRSPGTSLQRITVTFDVSTTEPNTFINQIAEHSYPTYGGFDWPFFSGTPETLYEFNTNGSVFLKENHSLPLFTPLIASGGLSTPTNHISVSTTIWLFKGGVIDSYVLGFNVIPEPSGWMLVVSGVSLLLSWPIRFAIRRA